MRSIPRYASPSMGEADARRATGEGGSARTESMAQFLRSTGERRVSPLTRALLRATSPTRREVKRRHHAHHLSLDGRGRLRSSRVRAAARHRTFCSVQALQVAGLTHPFRHDAFVGAGS
jgi:hypothetical protein